MRSRRTIQIHVEFQYVIHPVVGMGYVKDQANVIVKWDGNGHLNIRDLLINEYNHGNCTDNISICLFIL